MARDLVASLLVQFTTEQAPLNGSPSAVEDVLLDPAFVEARAALPKLSDPELLENTLAGDHAHQRIRFRFTEHVSGAVAAVVDPARLTWVDDATFDLAAHITEHRIVPDHYADRLVCSYRATITADGDASRRVLTGSVKVRMPLVGGKVERVIVSGLMEYAEAEATLINEWLARG